MKHLVWLFPFFLLLSCNRVSQQQCAYIDSLNAVAYRIRYSDIDSTLNLSRQAYENAGNYTDGKARALNMLAYIAYQQMDYRTALGRLDSVGRMTNNQVTLLVSDVLRMKINQRTGDGIAFYEARVSAQKRMDRAEEEYRLLQEEDLRDFFFARTEYHIISSTYYYYLDQAEEAKSEMAIIQDDFLTVRDSTQWLYYNYMLGSGGLVDGERQDVALQEFLYLMRCYGLSRSAGVTYFEANAMQALASRLSDEADRSFIASQRPDLYQLLLYDHEDWLPLDSLDVERFLPEALAQHAVYTFRRYKDLFQMACAYRTLGEIGFRNGNYEQALHNYSLALECVNEQYLQFHPQDDSPLLVLCPDDEDEITDTELRWIDSDSILTVPEWIAGIRQQISLVFSALGMTDESDYNRNIYLDIIARTSQNYEMEGRKEFLQAEADSLRLRLILSAVFFVSLVVLIVFFYYRVRQNNYAGQDTKDDDDEPKETSRKKRQQLEIIKERIEELDENANLCNLKIASNKRNNAEKRAKVSLVHAVMPFLDRILNEISRMNRDGKAREEQMDYVIELTDRIVTYNDILTEWIKMEQGELSLQISTIQLNSIFKTLQRGHYAYDQKGIRLDVRDTDLCVKADEALTLFMLNTLADNARKFTPEGGQVTVEAVAKDDYVELSVTDTGCGMTPEDVELLTDSKVYDARKIGTSTADGAQVRENKGFGFGIMNCRGIIEKYRKTSALFQVCRFGVESEVGKGSRFFFRLPRVTTMFLLLFSTFVSAQEGQPSVQTLYEETYQLNQEGAYWNALYCGLDALQMLHPNLCLSAEDEAIDPQATNEQALFLRQDTIDYLMAINIRNEIARAALALNKWDIYRYNNNLCTTLYRLCHQDHTLPTYCERLQRTQATSRQLLVLLVLFAVLTVLFALMLLRRQLLHRFVLISQALEEEEKRKDELSHLHYEENRVHVQNQVLDNCLSTIKHESMYYPARIRQLAERSKNGESDLQEITELAQYYKEVYTLLSAQAEKQTQQNCFRMEKISLRKVLQRAERNFQKLARKARLDIALDIPASTDLSLHADPVLLEELFERFNKTFVQWYAERQLADGRHPRVTVEQQEDSVAQDIRISYHLPGIAMTDDEAHALFYPESRHIHLLVAKQIVRELDALCNFPGLRLVAENAGGESVVWFTLK